MRLRWRPPSRLCKSPRALCRRWPCPKSARPMSAARAARHLDRGRVLPACGRHREPVSSPPIRRRSCAPPSWAPKRCSRLRTWMESTCADPKKRRARQALDRLTHDEAIAARPQGHGRHRIRACPGKPYAYHRVLDPGQGCDPGGIAGRGALDCCRFREPGLNPRSGPKSVDLKSVGPKSVVMKRARTQRAKNGFQGKCHG